MKEQLRNLQAKWHGVRFRILPFVNIISFALNILFNILSQVGALGGGTNKQISDENPTEFTPAGYAFSVWGPIYFFVAVFCVSQIPFIFLRRRVKIPVIGSIGLDNDLLFGKVGFLFFFVNLWSIIWLILFPNRQYWASTVFLVLYLVFLIAIYVRADVRYDAAGFSNANIRDRDTEYQSADKGYKRTRYTWEYLAVNVFVSMNLGWLCVATIAGIAISWRASFKNSTSPSAEAALRMGWTEQGWSVVMQSVAFVLAMALGYLRKDFVFTAVISWALYAIGAKHYNDSYDSVKTAAFVLGSLSAIVAIACVALSFKDAVRTYLAKRKVEFGEKQQPSPVTAEA